MCDCNGDGLATLSAFLFFEMEAKKAQNSSLHETGLFSWFWFEAETRETKMKKYNNISSNYFSSD